LTQNQEKATIAAVKRLIHQRHAIREVPMLEATHAVGPHARVDPHKLVLRSFPGDFSTTWPAGRQIPV
jgi:hypothetical protein